MTAPETPPVAPPPDLPTPPGPRQTWDDAPVTVPLPETGENTP